MQTDSPVLVVVDAVGVHCGEGCDRVLCLVVHWAADQSKSKMALFHIQVAADEDGVAVTETKRFDETGIYEDPDHRGDLAGARVESGDWRVTRRTATEDDAVIRWPGVPR